MFVSSLISPKFYIPCSFPNIKFVPQSMFSCLIWMKCIAQGIIVRQKAEETITQGCVYVRVYLLNRVRLFATLWTVARQTPLSMGFSRQAYWSGLPFSPPGGLSGPGIKPGSPALSARSFLSERPVEPDTAQQTLSHLSTVHGHRHGTAL